MRKAFIEGAGLALFIFLVVVIACVVGAWIYDIVQFCKVDP